MNTTHFQVWPKRVTKTLTVPETTLYDNLQITAKKYPNKIALHYYGADYTYKQLHEEVLRAASYLQNHGVVKEEKVILFMQNSVQFIVSFYAIMRLEAVAIALNPMSKSDELAFYIQDCQAKYAIIGQEFYDLVQPLKEITTLKYTVVANYRTYADVSKVKAELPDELKLQPLENVEDDSTILWKELIMCEKNIAPYHGKSDDLAIFPYTSGTTSLPKGCMHTHKTVQANVWGAKNWTGATADFVFLASLPFFHVTGNVQSLQMPIAIGAKIVIMTRWNRDYASECIDTHHVNSWVNIATMLIDYLYNPNYDHYNHTSLEFVAGGGATLSKAVNELFYERSGLRYVEGYGLSETMAQTHFNPVDCPKPQCLGVPAFDVDARIMNLETNTSCAAYEVGEIIINGPQVFKGYYNREQETRDAFIEVEDKMFFKTGDLGYYDEEGYFYMVDRVKRMINVSGYKVWPNEVESKLYEHPKVQQVCVVGTPHIIKGEEVKAYIILKDAYKDQEVIEEIVQWSKEQMAAYKYPRIIEIVETLPMTSSGKILWRTLQEQENQKTTSS